MREAPERPVLREQLALRPALRDAPVLDDQDLVGAGSVVTRDLPAGVVAFGNPARVHREIAVRDVR